MIYLLENMDLEGRRRQTDCRRWMPSIPDCTICLAVSSLWEHQLWHTEGSNGVSYESSESESLECWLTLSLFRRNLKKRKVTPSLNFKAM